MNDQESISQMEDIEITCIDCSCEFVWSEGEQEFFRDKGLKNPPKRCKDCKKAKNERIAATQKSIEKGESKIEVAVVCDKCEVDTTVPFYPSEGRPVLCRSCFLAETP